MNLRSIEQAIGRGSWFEVGLGSWSCKNAGARFQAVVAIGICGLSSTRTAAIGI
jgi:hypothetical protein